LVYVRFGIKNFFEGTSFVKLPGTPKKVNPALCVRNLCHLNGPEQTLDSLYCNSVTPATSVNEILHAVTEFSGWNMDIFYPYWKIFFRFGKFIRKKYSSKFSCSYYLSVAGRTVMVGWPYKVTSLYFILDAFTLL
jgi:hypothetical protein